MKTLLQRARRGDSEAFAHLFQEQADMLWRTVMAVVRDEDTAADILQETAVKAWMSIPSFNGESKLSTWLTRILLNAAYDTMRKQQSVIPFSDLRQGDLVSHEEQKRGVDVETKLDIDATLEKMEADDRLVLALFYGSDLPIIEIAALLELSEGAVRTRLTRARARFKDLYTQTDIPEPMIVEAAS